MPMLLRDKILIVLHGGGPRTNSEIAEVLSTTTGSVSTANNFNYQVGYVQYNGQKKAGERSIRILSAGVKRIETQLQSTYVRPPARRPVHDKLIAELRKGLWSHEWAKTSKSKKALQARISIMKSQGYTFKNKKNGTAVQYILDKCPPTVP